MNELDHKIYSKISNLSKSFDYHYTHIRLKIRNIDKPVTFENKLFNKAKGGILYNISSHNYYIDYYKSSDIQILTIKEMLSIISKIYCALVPKTRLNKKLIDYSILKELYNADFSIEVIKNLLELLNPDMYYTIEKNKLEVKSVIFDNSLKDIWKIFVDKSSVNNDAEIKVAAKMIKNTDLNKYKLCIYIPSIKVSSKQNSSDFTDFDVFLLCYNNKRILIKTAEVKSGTQTFNSRQIRKYLESLGIRETKIINEKKDGFEKGINIIDRNCKLTIKKQDLVDSIKFKEIELLIPF